MILYIDGDAFPNALKRVVSRAVERLSLACVVVSNQPLSIGSSKHITYLLVDTGADEADHKIVEMVQNGDLVVTADIPLADRVIEKEAWALDHRGKLYTAENIKQSLALRNLMSDLRENGEVLKGPAPFSQKDANLFANQFSQFLDRHMR